MVGVDNQFQNFPSPVGALLPDDLLAIFPYRTSQHRLTSFGSPDQVKDDQVYSVFIALVFHPAPSHCGGLGKSIAQKFAFGKPAKTLAEALDKRRPEHAEGLALSARVANPAACGGIQSGNYPSRGDGPRG
jgi:hypothetical protein